MSLFATGLGVMGLFRQRSPGHVPGFFLGAMLHRMSLHLALDGHPARRPYVCIRAQSGRGADTFPGLKRQPTFATLSIRQPIERQHD
jgi:hypothetical protein